MFCTFLDPLSTLSRAAYVEMWLGVCVHVTAIAGVGAGSGCVCVGAIDKWLGLLSWGMMSGVRVGVWVSGVSVGVWVGWG